MEDSGQGLVKRVETAPVPTLETKEPGARPLPDPWDRVVGRSVGSVTRRVPSRDPQEDGKDWRWRGREAAGGKGGPGKALETPSSSCFCRRGAVTPGVLVEGVDGVGGSWPRPRLPAPVPPDSPAPAGEHLTQNGGLHFSCSPPSHLLLFNTFSGPMFSRRSQKRPEPMRPAAPDSSDSINLSRGPETRNF